MFKKLQQHWGVSSIGVALIIATFALGGSACGYLGRLVLNLLNIENGAIWTLVYILLITLLWPICVLLISIPFGQFSFFSKYVGKLLSRFKRKKTASQTTNIAIYASGAGSNAAKIIEHFKNAANIHIALLVCNKPDAGVLQIAAAHNIPALLIEKDRFFMADAYLPDLQKHHINFIVLAGFLWKMPGLLVKSFPKKIVNIHPALLPKYGGKGMYGHFVHEAVIAAKETESGISIHYVDELYDHGEIIFQAKCPISNSDTPQTLAAKIHVLEHLHYPAAIDSILQNRS